MNRKLRTDARVRAARRFLTRTQKSDGGSMSDAKQQDIRSIHDVTDDEIIDAIAVHGLLGIDLDDAQDGNAIERACLELGLVGKDELNPFANSDVDVLMAERMHSLDTCTDDARVYVPVANYFMLTPLEWGRRLAGKSADEITKALRGGSP
jgi:hypothetical protein